MWKSNVLLGLATAGLALYVLNHSSRLAYRVGFGPGPGFAPWWIALTLLVVSAVFVAANLVRRDATLPFPITREALIRATGLFVTFGAAILLIEPFGFTIAMALFLIVVLRLFEDRPWLYSIGVGVLAAVAVFALFAIVFDVPLPRFVRGFI